MCCWGSPRPVPAAALLPPHTRGPDTGTRWEQQVWGREGGDTASIVFITTLLIVSTAAFGPLNAISWHHPSLKGQIKSPERPSCAGRAPAVTYLPGGAGTPVCLSRWRWRHRSSWAAGGKTFPSWPIAPTAQQVCLCDRDRPEETPRLRQAARLQAAGPGPSSRKETRGETRGPRARTSVPTVTLQSGP